jgi:hypothetical protein
MKCLNEHTYGISGLTRHHELAMLQRSMVGRWASSAGSSCTEFASTLFSTSIGATGSAIARCLVVVQMRKSELQVHSDDLDLEKLQNGRTSKLRNAKDASADI